MSELNVFPLDETDASQLFGLVNQNRARLKKFWWEATTRSPLDSRRFIVDAERQERRGYRPESISRGIFADDRLIGVGGIHSIEWNLGRAALGYWLDEAEDGKGYATEAVHQLGAIAFTELKLKEVTISPRESNVASRRVAEKNGFLLDRIDSDPEWQLGDGEEAPRVAHYVLSVDHFTE